MLKEAMLYGFSESLEGTANSEAKPSKLELTNIPFEVTLDFERY